MDGDQIFRIAFWVLFGLLLLIRILSILMVRLAGEWFMPGRKAVEREGRWMFTARVGVWRRPTDRQLDIRIAGSDCDLWLARKSAQGREDVN